MGTIISLAVLAILTFGALYNLFRTKGHYDGDIPKKGVWGAITGIFAFAFLLTFVLCSTINTNARTIDIITEFGKATGTTQPGLNWVDPWAEKTEFPTSNQVLDLDATNDGPNVAVKFKGGGSGFVNVNITWQVQNDDQAVKLWQNWKEFDSVKNNVVNPRGQAAVVEAFGNYTPEEAIDGNKLEQFNADVKANLERELNSNGIIVENVAIKRIDLSPEIQDRINAQVKAQADVAKAQIEQQRAQIDNATNQLRQQSLTPEALIRQCLDVANAWDVQKNGPLPASWNCFTGTTLPLTKSVG